MRATTGSQVRVRERWRLLVKWYHSDLDVEGVLVVEGVNWAYKPRRALMVRDAKGNRAQLWSRAVAPLPFCVWCGSGGHIKSTATLATCSAKREHNEMLRAERKAKREAAQASP